MSLTARYGPFSATVPARDIVMGFSGPIKPLSRAQARPFERLGHQLLFHREGARRWQASSNDMASNENEFDLSQCVSVLSFDSKQCPYPKAPPLSPSWFQAPHLAKSKDAVGKDRAFT
jgi:hypothetical protein